MTRRASLACAIGFGLWLSAVGQADGDDGTPELPDAPYDCGTKALYFLLRFEGRSADPDRIVAALNESSPSVVGNSSPQGRSMKDLRDGAARLGLALDGVRWPRGGSIPDRPVIAFLDRKPHGHFIAVRPVGHSGKLVQVFDGEAPPEVIDASRLTALNEWTGLILTSHRSNWSARLAGGAMGLILIAYPIAKGFRSRPRAR